MAPGLYIPARLAQSGSGVSNLAQFIAWPPSPLMTLFMPNGRVGGSRILKTSQTFYGPDPKGESGSMN